MSHLTYLQAAVIGLIQGITEMFPISSLGHGVLIPALIGGDWASTLNVNGTRTPYLAFIVGLHVATALALMAYFWRDWVRIIRGFFSSLRTREIETADQKLAWMIIFATIPVGVVGVVFQEEFRTLFGTAIYAGIFLFINGLILLAGEFYQRRTAARADSLRTGHSRATVAESAGAVVAAGSHSTSVFTDPAAMSLPARPIAESNGVPVLDDSAPGERTEAERTSGGLDEESAGLAADRRLARLGNPQAVLIGSAQILALLAGISRDGVVMVAGVFRGLSREDAARFSFLLSTPVILAAGVLKLPVLFGPLGRGIAGPVLLGSALAAVAAYLSIRFLVNYLRTRTLTPFAIYCLIAGAASVIYLGLIK